MNREELFIERMDELRTRLDSQKEYDILCAGNLIFQLILDRNKELANLVNTNEINIIYQIADTVMEKRYGIKYQFQKPHHNVR